MARPTDYKNEYCTRVVELGKQGKSFTQIACDLDVAKSTLYLWREVHPEFSDALTCAREYSQAWWEDIGQAQMVAPLQGFSASLFAKQVSCRFPDDYTDKSKSEIGMTGDIVVKWQR
jgi:hypothetical protein